MLSVRANSQVHGVRIGVQTYVFTASVNIPHERVVDVAIQAMRDSGVGECDLFAPIVEPADFWTALQSAHQAAHSAPDNPKAAAALTGARERLAAWRTSVPLDHYGSYRKRFNDAGIEVHAISGFPASTAAEFKRTLEIAGVLGARLITLGVDMPTAKMLAPVAREHDVLIGFQGSPDLTVANPDVIAQPSQFLEVAELAKNYRISLDIGDAVGGGWDVLPFIEGHPERIALIYLKDRRKDRLSVPWGQGDTPVREVLRFIRDRHRAIRCYIDCDYKSDDRPGDIKRSMEYIKAALA